jgi:hypothetical protein
LIYSEAFNSLPSPVKEKVYTRLYAILSGEDTSEPYQLLSEESRLAILQILSETKTDLPSFWQKGETLSAAN